MNILYYGQHSMRTYSKPIMYRLDKDGALQRQLARIAVLPKSYRWTLLLPYSYGTAEYIELPPELFRLKNDGYNIETKYYRAAHNVAGQRFATPDPRWFEDNNLGNIDVMLCEMPEHVGYFRQLQDQKILGRFPIVTKVLHVELFDETKPVLPYFWRQLEGISFSDAVIFPLKGIYEAFKAHAHKLLSDLALQMLDRPTHIWNGMFSPKLFLEGKAGIGGIPMRVAFISRLSDDKRTRASQFLAEMERFAANEASLKVADPTEMIKQGGVDSRLVFSLFGSDRADYIDTLRHWSTVVPILYDQGLIASIGFCEAAWAGNIMVHPASLVDNNLNHIGCAYHNDNLRDGLLRAFEAHVDGYDTEMDRESIYHARSTDVEAEKMQELLESVTC